MKYRFYFNVVGGIPLTIQQEAARPDGWSEDYVYTYVEKKNGYPKERNKVISDCRGDEGVWCYSFVCLVPRQNSLAAVRALLKKHGTFAYEGRTGWSTKGKREADIIEHSTGYWAARKLTHEQAVEFGSKGGKISVKKRRAASGYMPKMQALKIWRSANYSTWREALEAINADENYNPIRSLSTANRYLGERGLPSGPRGPRSK